MSTRRFTDRRTVLKTFGAGLVGATVLAETGGARGTVVSQINRDGHWAWFPLAQEHWGRQKHPYDFRLDDSRWMGEPTAGGGVRARVENIGKEGPPNRNTGFDIHMGPIGDLDEITFASRTVRTQVGSEARLFVGLYLDENKDGEFFHWETVQGDRERALPGPGGDEEGLLFIDAGGSYTISDSTTFLLLVRGFKPATLGEVKAGDIDGIDASTPAALYLGVIDKEAGGAEEVVIEDVTIRKS